MKTDEAIIVKIFMRMNVWRLMKIQIPQRNCAIFLSDDGLMRHANRLTKHKTYKQNQKDYIF